MSNMTISELIKELQEVQKEHGDIESKAPYLKFLTGGFIPIEDDGITFDKFMNGGNELYIDKYGISKRQTNKESDPA